MEDEELLQRIQIDPRVMAGQPVVRGTRLTVEFILNLLAHGAMPGEIAQEYSGVTDADIQACLLFDKSARAQTLRRLLDKAEDDVSKGRVRSMRSFLKEFKRSHIIR